MSVTKRPKRVDIVDHEVIESYPSYVCPSCHTEYVGSGPGKRTIRFRCLCGQELIVNKRTIRWDDDQFDWAAPRAASERA